MGKIKAIKDEIESMKEENSIGLCEYDAGYCNGVGETCDNILKFIDSLPEEPVSEDLEEEINNYIKDNFFGSGSMGFLSNRTKGELDSVDVTNIARHFAEWQKNKSELLTTEVRGSSRRLMINRGDMEYMLEKMAKHKDEHHESDRLFLEEYKSRCKFYKEFIKYLHEECAGDKSQIIEAVSTNEKNEFIGYVETEKEIDNNGNLIFKFKVDDIACRAYWQQDDNYAVCQWTGYEPDDYHGYILFPTYNFKKFFCIYYTC